MGAACALQGWSALQFSFSHTDAADLEHFTGALDNNTDIRAQPAQLALWASVARMLGAGRPRRSSKGQVKAHSISPLSPGPHWPWTSPSRRLIEGQRAHRCELGLTSGVDFEQDDVEKADPQQENCGGASMKDGWVGAPTMAPLRHNAAKGIPS